MKKTKHEIITEAKYSKYNPLISKWEWAYKTVVTRYNETYNKDEDLSPEVTCPHCKEMLPLDSLDFLHYSHKKESFICESCEGDFENYKEEHERQYREALALEL